MEGLEVVTTDDHKLGRVIAERDDCVVIETGHVLKSKHAIPRSFLHEREGVLRATVAKDVITGSPKVDLENWDCAHVNLHYGLETTYEVDPDAEGLDNAETAGARAGVTPAPAERLKTLGKEHDQTVEGPVVRDRMANALDPGVSANLSDENRS
jgi:hypothetical protein